MTKRVLNRFLKVAEGWKGSQRELASKYNISLSYCQELLKKNGIKSWKRVDAPKSSPAQILRQRERLNVMTNQLVPVNGLKELIEDDESYFPLSGKLNKWFLSSSPKNVDENTRFKFRSKFAKRLCVWIAISPKGHSEPFFLPANCAINSDIYRNECIVKRLVPFIEQNYQKDRYLFWPDGASCHYARDTIEIFEKYQIEVVKKDQNPPNVPQLRSIERFWAHLKHKVYEKNWYATDFDALKRRIKLKLKEFDLDYFQRLFAQEKEKIAKAATHGPLSVIRLENKKNSGN